MTRSLKFDPGTAVQLGDLDSRGDAGEFDKSSGREAIKEESQLIEEFSRRLYAEDRRSILLVLQGMDTAGKDGTIRSLIRGLNPQSTTVQPFKQPTDEELDHDFLWRIHAAVPRRGEIGIFNRSHYEDVLVVRVRNLVPKKEWKTRYERINDFERHLVQSGTVVLKCFLFISKDEQRERLQARIDNRAKHWKFSKADLAERKLWDDYIEAYEAALTRCNTSEAPWHIIPSDRKWLRNLTVARLLRRKLEEMDPQYPQGEDDLSGIVVE